MTGNFTYQEIMSQPEAWSATLTELRTQAKTLHALFANGRYEQLVFTGCGSTHYLALAAAALAQQELGTSARGLPASEIWLYPASSYLPRRQTLLIAISRSGETTETVRAVEAFKRRGTGHVLTLSCYPGRALATAGNFNLVLTAGQEESVAQTRAFSALYLATVALTLLWKGANDGDRPLSALDRLPEIGRMLLRNYAPLTASLGRNSEIERFYFLGSGPRYGLASELSLKMKEMSLSHSEPFNFLEFRHGPQSMVNDRTLMIGLRGETNRDYENAVLEEMRARGAQILCMDEHDADVAFASGLPEALRNVLYLPVGQMLAFERALSRGLDPDRPHNLDAVVKLDV
jgi:glucosamine--fructose-6-phosphate aminotransferase (isomerizing)